MANFRCKLPLFDRKWPISIGNDRFSLRNDGLMIKKMPPKTIIFDWKWPIFARKCTFRAHLRAIISRPFFIMIIQYGRQWGGIEQCRTEYVLEHIRRFHQKRIFYTSYFPPNILSDSYSSTYFGQMMSTYCREHVIDTLDKMRGNQTEIRINQKP